MNKEEKKEFYNKIMTYTIQYGVLRADYPNKEEEMTELENKMREYIKTKLELNKKCERCDYEEAEYRPQWGKILCSQCNLDYDSPGQEELESRF